MYRPGLRLEYIRPSPLPLLLFPLSALNLAGPRTLDRSMCAALGLRALTSGSISSMSARPTMSSILGGRGSRRAGSMHDVKPASQASRGLESWRAPHSATMTHVQHSHHSRPPFWITRSHQTTVLPYLRKPSWAMISRSSSAIMNM